MSNLPASSPEPDETRCRVQLDPERLADCVALAEALATEAGVNIDPGKVRAALRAVLDEQAAP